MIFIFFILLVFLTFVTVSYLKSKNEFEVCSISQNSLKNRLDELNFEFNALDNKLNKIESHYDKIKRIFNDLSELNSQSLESNKDRLTRVYQIQTEKYYNKDTVKKELEYHITSLNKELTK